jgi:hypothetical protein
LLVAALTKLAVLGDCLLGCLRSSERTRFGTWIGEAEEHEWCMLACGDLETAGCGRVWKICGVGTGGAMASSAQLELKMTPCFCTYAR